eukprot:CAMPEP_0179073586 /NCGR_PEP_ID=MMETSP0796-20121207/32645_1 /TAXON_ID=73915 /ORGANISM="Pyrodinium bahamense, Strain pbaha01" /LENGTH=68 /DNA_ID=CAMNT_0020770779 /DNA_START=270 /DNA_END=473 /DNA_ORIENTATION=-
MGRVSVEFLSRSSSRELLRDCWSLATGGAAAASRALRALAAAARSALAAGPRAAALRGCCGPAAALGT